MMMRAAFRFLILATLLVQAAIPVGFMPASAAAGTPIVICSGMDMRIIHVDEHGQPVEGGEEASDEACPFTTLPTAQADTSQSVFAGLICYGPDCPLYAFTLVFAFPYPPAPPATAPPVVI